MPYPTPTTDESFRHYDALQQSSRYLPMDQLADGFIYLIHARNSYLGVWDSSQKGFVIVREKMGRLFLFTEFHWDTGAPFGTAKPFIKLAGPVVVEDRRKALDEAQAQTPHEAFMVMTRCFLSPS